MEEVRWTWRQRGILFAIYCALLFKLIPGTIFILIRLAEPSISFYHRVPLHPWLEVAALLAAAAVWLTELFGPRIIRFAVSRL